MNILYVIKNIQIDFQENNDMMYLGIFRILFVCLLVLLYIGKVQYRTENIFIGLDLYVYYKRFNENFNWSKY